MIFFSDDLPPQRQERPPSPPPAYDEVTKQRPTEVDGISPPNDCKIDLTHDESPPEYAMAIAMSLAANSQENGGVQNQVPKFYSSPIFFKIYYAILV